MSIDTRGEFGEEIDRLTEAFFRDNEGLSVDEYYEKYANNSFTPLDQQSLF